MLSQCIAHTGRLPVAGSTVLGDDMGGLNASRCICRSVIVKQQMCIVEFEIFWFITGCWFWKPVISFGTGNRLSSCRLTSLSDMVLLSMCRIWDLPIGVLACKLSAMETSSSASVVDKFLWHSKQTPYSFYRLHHHHHHHHVITY